MIKYVSQEGFYTLNIKRLFLYVIACGIFAFGGMGAVHACTINEIDVNDDGTNCQTAKFTLTTTETTETDSFQFYISAAGTFYVDCGDNGTLTSTANDITNNDTITRLNTTGKTYTCTWTNSNTHTIRFGGSATGYSTSYSTAAIRFNVNISQYWNDTNAKKISSISGSLGQIFGTIENPSTGSGQPRFYVTFYGASNMTGTDGDYALPQNLFDGISGAPVSYMFYETFRNCSSLSGSIPENLFGNLYDAPASNMFYGTFNGCSGLSGTIPSTLFGNISGAPATYMFYGTFYGCSGLSGPIPANLFSGISGAPAQSMFNGTFSGCSGLTGTNIEDTNNHDQKYAIPPTLFSGISGAPASSMFYDTFRNCSSLSGSIPADLFGRVVNGEYHGISGAPAWGMFWGTFYGCSDLSGSIPKNLFGRDVNGVYHGINGTPAWGMFGCTFENCSGLSGTIPENLFGRVVNDQYHGIDGAPAGDMFHSTFRNCSSLSGSIPENLFGNVYGAPASNMFYDTFNGCSGLSGFGDKTYVPGDFLNGIVGDGTSVSNQVTDMFRGTRLDKPCPAGTYTSTRAQFNDAGKPWCSTCPDGTTSTAGATSANDCVPAYTITYNCGGGTGDVPENQIVINGDNFTPAQNTCTAPNNQHFTGWLISDTDNTIVQPGDAFQYLYTTNKTLTAQWENDVINIFWFNDNTQLTVPTASQSCEYGGGITLPEPNPSKPGYAFRGWRVRPRFDMTTLSAAEPSGDWMSKGFIYGDNQQFCDVNEEGTTCDDPRLADLSNGEWSVSFGADGTIKGIARCSKTAGETNGLWNNGYNVFPENIRTDVSDDLNETGAKYCWCRASGHAESGSNNYQSVASPAWVFNGGLGFADNCVLYCANSCAYLVYDDSAFRRVVFGVTE